MTDISMSAQPAPVAAGGALYRLVWKWHFLASLYVLPFMAMLAVTGGIYLFKPQIEAYLYADRMTVPVGTAMVSYEDQIAALNNHSGVKKIRSVRTAMEPGRTTVIDFKTSEGVRSIAWVNPYTGEVLDVIARDSMAMRVLRKLHGELLLGKVGTKFVELSAHWAVVMFVTGIYLWWPRGTRSWSAAIKLPSGTGRRWWRETHLFTGFLAVLLVVPILISGLPWTDVWGGGLSYVQKQTGQSSKSLRFGGDVQNSTTSEGTPIPYAQVFEVAAGEGLVAPLEMRPAKGAEGAYWVRSASRNRSQQTELIVDQYSGAVLKRHNFSDNPVVAKTVSYGISFHQGELYGWLNLAQNVLASVLALLLSVSGFIVWWKRRPAGSLGVPATPDRALGASMIALIVILSVLFPLMGASLLLALALDWMIFRKLGWFRGATA